MTISELEKEMKAFVKGASWIKRNQVAEYLGYERHSAHVSQAVKGCVKFGSKYHIHDVATNIYEQIGREH